MPLNRLLFTDFHLLLLICDRRQAPPLRQHLPSTGCSLDTFEHLLGD